MASAISGLTLRSRDSEVHPSTTSTLNGVVAWDQPMNRNEAEMCHNPLLPVGAADRPSQQNLHQDTICRTQALAYQPIVSVNALRIDCRGSSPGCQNRQMPFVADCETNQVRVACVVASCLGAGIGLKICNGVCPCSSASSNHVSTTHITLCHRLRSPRAWQTEILSSFKRVSALA